VYFINLATAMRTGKFNKEAIIELKRFSNNVAEDSAILSEAFDLAEKGYIAEANKKAAEAKMELASGNPGYVVFEHGDCIIDDKMYTGLLMKCVSDEEGWS
jgi:hypothetical protein